MLRKLIHHIQLRPYRRKILEGLWVPVFVHSHMRSGSTLLVHILCTHDRIYGSGETHITYKGFGDIQRLAQSVDKHVGPLPKNRSIYILDKLLHEYDFDVHKWSQVKSYHVFLIRGPDDCVASMVDPDFRIIKSQDDAELYFIRRMKYLYELYTTLRESGAPCVAVTNDELVLDTKRTLAKLTDFFSLDDSLSDRYRFLPTTGVKGTGDFSPNIFLGYVNRERKGKRHYLKRPVVKEAWECFERTRMLLIDAQSV